MVLPWLLVLELVLYAGCFICGIMSAASLTITQGHFTGQCILYGTVEYNTSGLILENPSHPSLCYFVSAISVSVAIYCFCLTLYWIYTSCVEEEVKRERLWLNVTLGVCMKILFFLAVSGCTLRIGRDRLCLSALHNVPSITSCEEAENKTWVSPYNGSQFYTGLYNAEKSVWVNFFFWVQIVVVVFVQKRQGLGSRSEWSVSETEPFFHRPV
ncbi:transmembrane protein 179B [Oncorhynchus mykiss]|uniref:Transmembrane protein 179B n=1 Tax=Oncorhynchus mykiss TaxID=8022 RepID=A0A8C7VY99_ONCMY|nr:transmembrane protein 179B [Oncorhynchus mykiss]